MIDPRELRGNPKLRATALELEKSFLKDFPKSIRREKLTPS